MGRLDEYAGGRFVVLKEVPGEGAGPAGVGCGGEDGGERSVVRVRGESSVGWGRRQRVEKSERLRIRGRDAGFES